MSNETIAAAVAPVAEQLVASAPTDSVSWYAVNLSKEGPDAEVSIYDAIGGFGIGADRFVNSIKGIKARNLNVRINSPGGDVFAATAMYNALRQHPSRIVVHIDGVAASAGSFLAMSGDDVRMADNAYLMMHNAHAGRGGDAADMRAAADMLDRANDNIAGFYEKKTGKPREHWRNLMNAETWFTAEEAKAQGLVDSIYAAEKKPAPSGARAEFDFKVYNRIPDAVKDAWGLNPQNAIAPEVSDGIVAAEPPPAVIQQEHTMAEANVTQAAPAQTPAAGATSNSSLGTFNTVTEAIENFKAVQGPQFIAQGRKEGAEAATLAFANRVTAIMEACPGKPEMALNAITTGQTADAVSLAYKAMLDSEAKAATDAKEKDLHILRLEALLATGGHNGGVNMGLASPTGDAPTASHREPKEQADWEWENNPLVRKTASTKEIYVLARAAELDGTHRTFTRKTA